MEETEAYFDRIIALVVQYGAKVALAILVLIVGLFIIRKLIKVIRRSMERRNVDPSLRPFLLSIIGVMLRVMLLISVAGMVGVEMTSFIAVLGGAALAIGLALQGSLSNFAGGVLILLLKPFKVGDFIEAVSFSGTVREIQIFYTYLTTPENQEIIIPNGDLSNNAVKNYSFNNTRRMDMTYGIGYGDNIDKAKAILEQLVQEENRFLKEPEHTIFVEALADSSVNLHIRIWATNSDFWDIYNNFPEKVKKAFDANGISIPFPQRDIHLYKEKDASLTLENE